jgi:hypothetical protein
VNRDTNELYRLIPIPYQEGNEMIKLVPVANHVAINLHKETFVPVTSQDCIHFDSMTLICPLQGPIYQLKADENLCVTDQITNKCKIDTSTCTNVWSEIGVKNTYLFFCCNQCKIKIICDQAITAEHLHGAGILNIKKNCIIKSDTFTIFSQHTPSSDVTIHAEVPTFEIPYINNVLNISRPKISDENKLEEYKGNQNFIKNIEQQIQQIKSENVLIDQVSYHDVHHYVAIYVVAAVLLILVVLFIRHYVISRRNRKRGASPQHLGPEAVSTQARKLPPPPTGSTNPTMSIGSSMQNQTRTFPAQTPREGDQHQESRRDQETRRASLYATIRPASKFLGFTRVR